MRIEFGYVPNDPRDANGEKRILFEGSAENALDHYRFLRNTGRNAVIYFDGRRICESELMAVARGIGI